MLISWYTIIQIRSKPQGVFTTYTPIEKQSRRFYELIIEKIKNLIACGQWKQGSAIPPERELAEMFGVSRVPVREALKTLEYVGIIENIRGQGMYVKKTDVAELLKKFNYAISVTAATISDLIEFRIYIEGISCELAAQRRTEEDIQVLKRIMQKMNDQLPLIGDEMDETAINGCRLLSRDFHSAIVRATKNRVFVDVYSSIGSLVNLALNFAIDTKEKYILAIKGHQLILDAIIEGNPEKAKAEMTAHLTRSRENDYTKLVVNAHDPEQPDS